MGPWVRGQEKRDGAVLAAARSPKFDNILSSHPVSQAEICSRSKVLPKLVLYPLLHYLAGTTLVHAAQMDIEQ